MYSEYPTTPNTFIWESSSEKGVFPKDWFVKRAKEDYLHYLAPYFAAAIEANMHAEFLDALFIVWFDRFPFVVKTEEEAEATDITIANLKLSIEKSLRNYMKLTKAEQCVGSWDDVVDLDKDRADRRACYYKWRARGLHTTAHQYINTVEIEADRLPRAPEELIDEILRMCA